MDPVSVALLGALAGGAGGEAGRQAWVALSALVRRPFRRDREADGPAAVTGEAALSRLSGCPDDLDCAQHLSAALASRAAADDSFAVDLRRWHDSARLLQIRKDSISNEISGGSFSGPVIQGRDFSQINFGAPTDRSVGARPEEPPSPTTG
jgi:hypothetical protein